MPCENLHRNPACLPQKMFSKYRCYEAPFMNGRTHSKECGQRDCGRANQMDTYEQKVVSLRRQRFMQPCLALARLG